MKKLKNILSLILKMAFILIYTINVIAIFLLSCFLIYIFVLEFIN